MANATVLVAEDDVAIGRLVTIILRRSQIECDHVVTGHQALEKLREKSYDVLICDLMMPGVNGYEVVRELADWPHRPAVVVVTAMAVQPHELDAEVVKLIIRKPFDMDTFVEVVRDLATRRERDCPNVLSMARRRDAAS